MRPLLLLAAALPLCAPAAARAGDGPSSYRFVLDPSGDGSLEAGVETFGSATALAYRGFMAGAGELGLHERWYLRPAVLTAVVMGLPSPGNFLHEYYGHGSALREYGYEAGTNYSWGWFHGAEGDAESLRVQASGDFEAELGWIAGGLEATQAWLLEHEKEMYRSGRASLLLLKPLLAAANDLGYVRDGLDPGRDPRRGGGDGVSWLDKFNQYRTGGAQGAPTAAARAAASRARSALDRADALDPAKYWAAFLALRYLCTGEHSFAAPALPLAGWRLGFSPKANLTPAGPENYYYFFLARDGRLLTAYRRAGEAPEGKISGYGAEFGPLRLRGAALTAGFDSWELPRAAGLRHSRGGSGWHLKADLPVWRLLGLTAKLGRKDAGYLLGRPDGAGAYGYAGLLLAF